MRAVQEAFQRAIEYHRAGDFLRAEEAYQEILREAPEHAGAWHLLGMVHHERGDWERAVEHIRRAIALNGSKAIYYCNLGVVLRAQGRLEEAAQAYRRALATNPSYPDAYSNLGNVLHDQGKAEEAIRCYGQALRLQPNHADALFNLGNVYRDQGQSAEAIRAYEAAVRLQPDRATIHNGLGSTFLSHRQPKEAARSYQKALAIDPGNAEAHLNLGAAYAELGMFADAAGCFETASRLRPNKPLWRWRSLGLCPTAFHDTREIDAFRSGLALQLDACGQARLDLDWRLLPADAPIPSFNLTHHGCNNRPLLEKFAGLFAPHFPQERPRVRNEKPRIGFLVTRPHQGGFLRSMAGIVEQLDASRFEPVVLCSEGILGPCRQGIQREVAWVPFSEQFPKAVETILAARCDLLYHWQIGTDPLNYFLPFARLAPVQCTAWGTHGTSGIAAVDYYLSSKLVEADRAEDHYSEELYRFDTLVPYQPRVPRPAPAARSHFGLPDPGHLYLCPQRLAKLHPDQDGLFRGVLGADPEGYLVLLKGRHEHAAELLQARWARTLGKLAGRVLFLPSQEPGDYYRLLSVADVILDTVHYSAGLTAYDAFSLGVPLVTLPDEFAVGRYACALYRRMGLEDLVARGPEQYLALAVRLGTDRDYREAVRSRIEERAPVLFEDRQAVREHERFFEDALDRVRD